MIQKERTVDELESLLKELTEAPGVAGYESGIR